MAKQNFANHVRYYAPHHFVFYPLLLIALSAAAYAYSHYADQKDLRADVVVIFIFIGWTSFMMRQHYALGNQNRIVRIELRFRYFVLTGKRLELFESKLSFPQFAALRFASDDELPALIERTVNENLSSRQIKKAIVNWLPDHMRV
jgi:Family of unknown function (DUF6526)